MLLSQASLNKVYKISHIEGSRILKRRLLEMGLTSNSDIQILRISPFKDPIIVKIRGYNLSLRLFEASHVVLKNI
jgi:ferrous iron transport protein A